MIKGFRDFILRGNVVDLAVAVVIGAAFGAVVTAFVADLITPLIAAAVYFVVVVPMNKVAERRARGVPPEEPATKQCPECLSEIPYKARKCAFCASDQHDAVVA